MINLFVRMHSFFARHRWATGLCLAALFAGLFWLTSRLSLSEDFKDMLPQSDPRIAGELKVLELFRQADRLLVDVSCAETNTEALLAATDDMAERLSGLPGLKEVRHRLDAAGARQTFQLLMEHLPCLLDSDDWASLDARLQTGQLEKRLAWMKKAMTEPQGAFLKDVVSRDPAGLGDSLRSKLQTMQAGFGDVRVVSGYIASPDGCHILLTATPDFPMSDTRRGAPLVKAALSAAREVERRFAGSGVRVAVGGGHRIALDNAAQIKRDTGNSSLLTTAACLLLVLFAYRRKWLALLSFAPTGFGIVAGAAVLFCTAHKISGVALGFSSMLIGMSIDYAIYIAYYLDDEQPSERRGAAEIIARMAAAQTFGMLTTVAAFLIMLASPVVGHRQVGLYATTGVIAAFILAFVAIPVFVPLSKGQKRPPLPLTLFYKSFFSWLDRRARTVIPLAAVFSLVCAFGVARLRFDGDAGNLNYTAADTARDVRVIHEVWAQALSLTAVVTPGSTMEEALQGNEKIRALLLDMGSRGEIGPFSSLASLLPSERTQRANLQHWREYWTPERRNDMKVRLDQVASRMEFRADAFKPFYDMLASPSEPLTAGQLLGTSLGDRVGECVREADGRFAVATLVKARDRSEYGALERRLREVAPDTLLANNQHLADMIADISREGLVWFGLLVTAAVAVLLLLLFGRLDLVFVAMFPVFVGLLWTLGVMALMGVAINMSNLFFVVLVLGVGTDYTVFLVAAKLDSARGIAEHLATTGGAVTLCALTTLLGVGGLAIARHPALFSVGFAALLGMGFSLISTVVLVPPMMDRLLRGVGLPPRAGATSPSDLRRAVCRVYRYQGPYVENYAYWKMKTDPLFPLLDSVVPRAGRVLDLGTGYGLVPHWLAACSPSRSFVGMDHDAGRIRVARAVSKGNPAMEFHDGDLVSWPYPPAATVLLMDVLHYVPDETKRIVLRKAFASLSAGGLLVMRDAGRNASAGHHVVASAEKWAVWIGHNKTAAGLHFASADEYVAMLSDAGFTGIEIRGDSGLGSNILIIARKSG